MNRSSERGNVLWFILIGVVLLGFLTAILSRSGSSVHQSGDYEKNSIKVSQLQRYAKGIQGAIEQMKLRGISENDLSFENPTTTVDYTNANCTTDYCKIFEYGGGLTYSDPPTGVNDGSEWIFTAANNVGTTAGPIGTTAAASGNDLLILLPNINAALCAQINRTVGLSTTPPTETTGIATTAFAGAFPGGGPTILDGDPTPFELDNQPSGCFTDTNANPDVTYYYYVLLAR